MNTDGIFGVVVVVILAVVFIWALLGLITNLVNFLFGEDK